MLVSVPTRWWQFGNYQYVQAWPVFGVGTLKREKDETKQGILNEELKELEGSSTYVFVLGHSVDPEWFSPVPTFQVVSNPNPDLDPTFKPGQLHDWRDL